MEQSAVETWLKKNEQFTNKFILNWVQDHPELHLALFNSNPSFTCYAPAVLPDKIVDPTSSKDSGVEIEQPDNQVQSELSIEKGLTSLKINEPENNLEPVGQSEQLIDMHPETIRAERIEAMLDMSVFLHARLFSPQQIVSKVMHSAQLFLGCTVVNLLLSESLPFLSSESTQTGSGLMAVELAKAFVILTKSECELPRKLEEESLPYLIEIAQQTEQTGLTFLVDEAGNMMCICLKSTGGLVVGFLVLMYMEEEFVRLTELDLMYIQFFSQICGMAIDNSLSVSALTNFSSKLCGCAKSTHDENIPRFDVCLHDNDSLSSFETLSDSEVDLRHSVSCPELLSSYSQPGVTSHQSF